MRNIRYPIAIGTHDDHTRFVTCRDNNDTVVEIAVGNMSQLDIGRLESLFNTAYFEGMKYAVERIHDSNCEAVFE